LKTGSLERRIEAALSPSAPRALIYRQDRPIATDLTPLSRDFLDALAACDEVLVTSREGASRGTVPMWFIIAPPGVVYLFTFAFSEKARRWRTDPWVRLGVPGQSSLTVEGVARFVDADQVDNALGQLIVDRWSMQGAPTLEGLRRTLRDRVHALIRVEAAPVQN
jgi:hypothetical protein